MKGKAPAILLKKNMAVWLFVRALTIGPKHGKVQVTLCSYLELLDDMFMIP